MRKVLFFLVIMGLISCTKEDNPPSGQNNFTGDPQLILQTEDLHVVTGFRNGSLWEFSILKTDTLGNKFWEEQFFYNDELHLAKMLPLDKGGFLVALNQRAHIGSEINDYFRLICMESSGSIKWQKKIDLDGNIDVMDVCLTPDNSLIVTGNYISSSKFYYCKIDNNQELNWVMTYSDSLEYVQVRQLMVENDSINLLGTINTDRVLLLRTDLNGTIGSQKEIQMNTNQCYFSETSSMLIAIENTNSGLGVEKINTDGSPVWQNTYDIPDCENTGILDLKISNNSYAILGSKNFSGIGEPGSTKNFLLKLSHNGDEVWRKIIADEDDVVRCIDIMESESIISAILNSHYENPGKITFYLEIAKD